LTVGGVAALIVAAVVLGGWWVAEYQPLSGGSVAGVGRVLPDGTVVPAADASNLWGQEFDVVEPLPGELIRMRTAFQNDGPLRVTITGVDVPLAPLGLWRTEMFVTSESVDEETEIPSDGITVEPGDFLQVRLDIEVPDCPPTPEDSRGRISWFQTVSVHYTVLGIEHTRMVGVGYAVGIVDGPACWLQ
jgi:hypothetical protein